MGSLAPVLKHQLFTNNGTPAASYKLFTYTAGTTTKLATYTDQALTSPNTNPIVLDSAGRASIFLAATSYKFVFTTSTDTDPPASPIWTVDNITSVPLVSSNTDVLGIAGENLVKNQAVYLSDGSGGKTTGRWYKADPTLDYASINARALAMVVTDITSGSSGTFRRFGKQNMTGLLTPGLVYYLSAGAAGSLQNPAPSAPNYVVPVMMGDSLGDGILPPALYYQNLLFRDVTAKNNSGTGETDFWTWPVPALANDGEGVDIDMAFNLANNANTKTVRLDINGQKLQLFQHAAGVASNVAYVRITASRFPGSLTTIRGIATFGAASGAAPTVNHIAATLPVDLGTARTWKITGQSGTASNDITGTDIRVRGDFGGALGS